MNRQSIHIYTLLAMLLFVSACGVQAPRQDSLQDAIATTAASIESLADQITELCGQTRPNGPCRAESLISTNDKNSFKRSLQDAIEATSLARLALVQDRSHDAADSLGRAQSILTIIRNELEGRVR